MSLNVAIEKVFTKTKRLCRCRLIKTPKTSTASVGVIFGGLGKLGESVTSQLFMNVSITSDSVWENRPFEELIIRF